MKDLVVGDKVSIFKFREFGGDLYLGAGHEVIKVTKAQIHVMFKNGTSQRNGEIFKFSKRNNIRVGESRKKDAFYVMTQCLL